MWPEGDAEGYHCNNDVERSWRGNWSTTGGAAKGGRLEAFPDRWMQDGAFRGHTQLRLGNRRVGSGHIPSIYSVSDSVFLHETWLLKKNRLSADCLRQDDEHYAICSISARIYHTKMNLLCHTSGRLNALF